MIKSLRYSSDIKSQWFSGLPDLLDQALDNYDLINQPEWQELAELSASTVFEGIDSYGDAAILEGDNLIAPGTVFVELNYGSGEDGVTFNDSYPIRIYFSISKREDDEETYSVKVEKIEIDTSSFYG